MVQTPAALAARWRTTALDVAWYRSCGLTTRSAPSCRSLNWLRSRPNSRSRCSDAVQTVGQVPVGFAASGLVGDERDHCNKFGGPAGVGALLLRRDTADMLLHGGGQERDVRSGTPDVAGVVGMAAAADIAVETLEVTAARLHSCGSG